MSGGGKVLFLCGEDGDVKCEHLGDIRVCTLRLYYWALTKGLKKPQRNYTSTKPIQGE